MRPAIVIPVHNRRETTRRCLQNLAATGVLAWAEAIIVDDGSTDGTATAVRQEFPGVTILPGDGSLWWGGAIRLGMEHALRADSGVILWLNDDCRPAPGTLQLLVGHAAATSGIAAGWAQTPSGGRYGGSRRTACGLRPVEVPPPGDVQACDAVSGNCVALARAVVETLGLPDARTFPHSLLDVDYTLSATERGFPLDLLGSALCHNDDNLQQVASSWLLDERSPMQQWKLFLQPRSGHGYRVNFWFHWRHWGAWGLGSFAKIYLKLALICAVRAVVPLRWLRAVYARRSSAWQRQVFHRQAVGETPEP